MCKAALYDNTWYILKKGVKYILVNFIDKNLKKKYDILFSCICIQFWTFYDLKEIKRLKYFKVDRLVYINNFDTLKAWKFKKKKYYNNKYFKKLLQALN